METVDSSSFVNRTMEFLNNSNDSNFYFQTTDLYKIEYR